MAERSINEWITSNKSKLTKFHNLSIYLDDKNVNDISLREELKTIPTIQLKPEGKTIDCQVTYFPSLTKIENFIRILDELRNIISHKTVLPENSKETEVLANELISVAVNRFSSSGHCKPSEPKLINSLTNNISKTNKTGLFFNVLSSTEATSLITLSLITSDITPVSQRAFVLKNQSPAARSAYILTTLHYYHSCLSKVFLSNLNSFVYGIPNERFSQITLNFDFVSKISPNLKPNSLDPKEILKGKSKAPGILGDPFNMTGLTEEQWDALTGGQKRVKTGEEEDEQSRATPQVEDASSETTTEGQDPNEGDQKQPTELKSPNKTPASKTVPSVKQDATSGEAPKKEEKLHQDNPDQQSNTPSGQNDPKIPEGANENPNSTSGMDPQGEILRKGKKHSPPDSETALTTVKTQISEVVDVVLKRMLPPPGAPLLCIYKEDKLPENFNPNTLEYFLKTTQFPEDSILSHVNSKAMEKLSACNLKGFLPEKYKALLKTGKIEEANKLLQIPERHMAMLFSDLVQKRPIESFHFVLNDIEQSAYKNAIEHYYTDFANALTEDFRSHFQELFTDLKSDLYSEKISSGEIDPPGFSDNSAQNQAAIDATTKSLLNPKKQNVATPKAQHSDPTKQMTEEEIQALIDSQPN